MEQPTIVTRTVELDLSPDDLWSLIGDGEAWADWMVDHADVDVVPGGGGSVTDDGVDRRVRIDEVDDGERVRFDWWPVAEPDAASTVELVVSPHGRGAVLQIVESLSPSRAVAAVDAIRAWEVRAVGAWACSLARATA